MTKLVVGVGLYDKGKYPSKVGGTFTKEYDLWKTMLFRCHSAKFHIKNPAYRGCSVSENFKSFQFFAEWCNQQVGFKNNGWQLDKDILFRGNKIYSEDTCCFVPAQLNSLLLQRGKYRGENAIGVSLTPSGKYLARFSLNGKRVYLGVFQTEEEAFSSYKLAKDSHVRATAMKYKDFIDARVYTKLLSWEVDFND